MKLMKLTKKSPAKINFFLQVLSKRDDGYHDLNSLMLPVSLFDSITITISDGYGLQCTVKEGNVEASLANEIEIPMNIAEKAVNIYLLKAHLAKDMTDYFIQIEIEKNIPIGAGLGGGSSNGATVLLMLEEMLKVGFSNEELREMAAELGSDVPFFIDAKPAIATGRGETLEEVDFPESHFILINPLLNISTSKVYGDLHLTKKGKNNILSYSGKSANSLDYLVELLSNDLEEGVIREYPVIEELKLGLREQGASGSLMTGSGSTVFGLFIDKDMASKALEVLSVKYKNYLVYHVTSLN